MSGDIYSLTKLTAYPDILADMQAGGPGKLVSVHLMPQNVCNHSCGFCSYRMDGNKNASKFDESKHIPLDKMLELVDDFYARGIKGVEITGGGEPLAYPYINELLEALMHADIRVGLVTNGTLWAKVKPELLQTLSWARVSIDAGNVDAYVAERKCPRSHWKQAWNAVKVLRKNGVRPEFKLGVSFVLSNHNSEGVFQFVDRASKSGADNCRLSATYSDLNGDYYDDSEKVFDAVDSSKAAVKRFHGEDGFEVHNLLPTRVAENEVPHQDYEQCPTKDLLCVVEGEGNVYMCCSWTGSGKGKYGNFIKHPDGFRGVWNDSAKFRAGFKACDYCDISCLYRARNLAMNALIGKGLHTEFI
ncbi:MAG: MoaA/NifB/PqqE/SkfB family radical SAM enzyme [Acidimicrobiales bacterium]|jgi:MoaA/NifB/PqqE/SkfB family radical SAM enzyme